MGEAYIYECENCGNKFDVHSGIGMRFLDIYEETINEINECRYGEVWKCLLNSKSNIAVDPVEDLYVCKHCGNWCIEKNLSLYEPKESVNDSGLPMPWELHDKYKILKRYVHHCSNCGKRMARTQNAQTLKCPRCGGTANQSPEIILWD